MHHLSYMIVHTTTFATLIVEHLLEREVAQWVHHEGGAFISTDKVQTHLAKHSPATLSTYLPTHTTHPSIHPSIYTHTHTHTHTHIYIHMYIHIHTHIHTYSSVHVSYLYMQLGSCLEPEPWEYFECSGFFASPALQF